jgi:hypothetical protein
MLSSGQTLEGEDGRCNHKKVGPLWGNGNRHRGDKTQSRHRAHHAGTAGSNPAPSIGESCEPEPDLGSTCNTTADVHLGAERPSQACPWQRTGAAIGKRVTVVDYPDGRLSIRYRRVELVHRTFDNYARSTKVPSPTTSGWVQYWR